MLAFWTGSIGALLSTLGLGFTVTGILPVAGILVYIGLTLFVVANIWDFMIGRKIPACANDECKRPKTGNKRWSPQFARLADAH